MDRQTDQDDANSVELARTWNEHLGHAMAGHRGTAAYRLGPVMLICRVAGRMDVVRGLGKCQR